MAMIDTPTDHEGAPQRAPHQPLYSEKVFSDRKIFFMDLKENDRGRFVKITEDVRGRRDTIMLPVEALDEFLEALNRVADFEEDLDVHPAEVRDDDPVEASDAPPEAQEQPADDVD
jgi:hypothetical protein